MICFSQVRIKIVPKRRWFVFLLYHSKSWYCRYNINRALISSHFRHFETFVYLEQERLVFERFCIFIYNLHNFNHTIVTMFFEFWHTYDTTVHLAIHSRFSHVSNKYFYKYAFLWLLALYYFPRYFLPSLLYRHWNYYDICKKGSKKW